MKYINKNIKQKYETCKIWREFYDYLISQNYYFHPHFLRYLNTFGAMSIQLKKHGIDLFNLKILETGDPSVISIFLSQFNEVYHTESDLRIQIDAHTEYFDIVLSLEVIEHLKDAPETNFIEIVNFQFSGVRNYFKELKRIYKSNSLIILTTPNPTSLRSIENIINYKHPYIYKYHVREYSYEEILDLINEFGFQILYYETQYNFFFMITEKMQQFEKFLDTNNRGDDHFFIIIVKK